MTDPDDEPTDADATPIHEASWSTEDEATPTAIVKDSDILAALLEAERRSFEES